MLRMQRDRPFIPGLPPAEKREKRALQNKQDIMGRRSVREGRNRIRPPGDMEVEAAAAEMATLETRKNEDDNNASPREEHPSVPGNYQSTAEVQQVRRDKRNSTEKGVVLTQVMEQDVEEVREKSEDVTIRRAKEVRQRPTTLTMDTEDKQTEEMQVPEHNGETPERGRGWRGNEHRYAEEDATPPAQATSPKRSKKLKTDRQGDNPPERRRSRTRTITTKTQ